MKKYIISALAIVSTAFVVYGETVLRIKTLDGKIALHEVDKVTSVEFDGEFIPYDTTGFGAQGVSITGVEEGYTYVDLGLKSGLRWATYNVGASTTTEFGDYFSWGETTPKEDYEWSTYKWCTVDNEGKVDILKKYCNVVKTTTGEAFFQEEKIIQKGDNLTKLLPVDDAAKANWGGAWRLPTHKEQIELVTSCTWKFVEKFNGSNINGYLGTSIINGNTIFLPAAGEVDDNINKIRGLNSGGCYMSSEILNIMTDFNLNTHCIRLDRYNTYKIVYAGEDGQSTTLRYIGQSVRPCADPDTKDVMLSVNTEAGSIKYGMHRIIGISYTSIDEYGLTQSGKVAEYSYVDLGLPSGLKWATSNIGANKPFLYGNKFSWGDTAVVTSNNLDWSTYKWCENVVDKYEATKTFTKYCTDTTYGVVDNLVELELEDDAAATHWGDTWRMPTKQEMQELLDGCTWEYMSSFNGREGYLGTSKFNDNTIFLPGRPLGTEYYTSSLSDRYMYLAAILRLRSKSFEMSTTNRYYSTYIRPVTR